MITRISTGGEHFSPRGMLGVLLASSAVLCIMSTGQAAAQTDGVCTSAACANGMRGKMADVSSTRDSAIGENTERERPADRPSIPFAISVDGETVEKSASGKEGQARFAAPEARPSQAQDRPVDKERRTDVGLNAVDIQVKFDGLESAPLLNVSTAPIRSAYRPGETVRFLATTNYPAFITRSQILISRADSGPGRQQPVEVIDVTPNGEANWTMPGADDDGDYEYVLRVYDRQGRYDETRPLRIARTERPEIQTERPEATAPGMLEDRTAVRNIPVRGGSITVYGRNVPPGYAVEVFGERIPVDPDRAFLAQRILPAGDHDVNVSVTGMSKDAGLHFSRDVNIPDNDWFYVALADLTVGKRIGDRGIEMVRPGEYDEVYSKGRVAFYLKGKIKGEYLLTAAADTGADNLENLFRNLDGKDPRRLLRRLDPDDFYPVYGDDSTFQEDAPTNGKFYVRLERGDSHVMWGNYRTSITGTEFMRQERSLYGAQGVYRSEDATSFGERRTEASVYAAQPDTLPAREEFLATGGSAYFLRRQDIVIGSETLTVEVRDEVTGRIVRRQTLRYGEDYSIDYIQGVIILRQPLSWRTGTDGPVRDGALGGNNVYLTAQYEFEPVASEVDGYVFGGRMQHWLSDGVRIGATGMDEGTGLADEQAVGADIQLRHSERTFLEAEIAHSKGPGFGLLRSTDGGLTSSQRPIAGRPGQAASAWRVRGQGDLADIPGSTMKGTVGGYYEEKEAGYSSLYDQTYADRRIWGGFADVSITDDVSLKLTFDDFHDAEGQTKRNGNATVTWQIDEAWKLSVAPNYREITSPQAQRAGKSGYDGSRVDAGARLDYKWSNDLTLYGFGQETLRRSGDIDRNDRVGLGAKTRLTDTIGAETEVSYGTHGWGGLAALAYDPTADDHYYLGYRLDPDRAFDFDRTDNLLGTDKGSIVGGTRRRLNEVTTAYAENSYDLFGRKTSLAQTYGVVYTPDKVWTLNAGFQAGRVRDDTVDRLGIQRSDFDRYAPSLSITYNDEDAGIAARLRGEVRIEDSADGTRDANTYLLAPGVSWKTSRDWRLLANAEAVISDTKSNGVSFQDTDYVEASLGHAYRPTTNDRLNALFKYTWLYDLPGNGQLVSGSTRDLLAPAQRSHILSADATYDLVPWISIGAKYGMRYGEVRNRTADGIGSDFVNEWQTSSAHLAILRADLHVVKNWDLLVEGRVLHMPQAETTDYGALAAVYRHVGNNFKVGVGYNFGQFSDDLRDLTLDDRGVFLNAVGKF